MTDMADLRGLKNDARAWIKNREDLADRELSRFNPVSPDEWERSDNQAADIIRRLAGASKLK